MKINYISDLHFHNNMSKEDMANYVETYLPQDEQKAEVIIVGGDISESNHITAMYLRELSKYYDKVFVVLGNHDYYIFKNSVFDSSLSRVANLKSTLKNNDKIAFLENYEVHSYKGYTFAGDTNWYQIGNDVHSQAMFNNVLADSSYIFSSFVEQDAAGVIKRLAEKGIRSYINLKEKVDVIATHLPPIATPICEQFNNEFGFVNRVADYEGIKSLNWIFAHTHENVVLSKPYCDFYSHAKGYIQEMYHLTEQQKIQKNTPQLLRLNRKVD